MPSSPTPPIYLIDLDHAVIVDVEASRAIRQAEVGAARTMIERAQLPGVTRIGRRVLVRQDALLDWLRQKSTPSLER